MSLGTEGPRIGSRWRPQPRHDDRLEIPGFPVDQNAGNFGERIPREIKVIGEYVFALNAEPRFECMRYQIIDLLIGEEGVPLVHRRAHRQEGCARNLYVLETSVGQLGIVTVP